VIQEHFRREIKRLQETFPGGDRFYTAHRVAMLWRHLERADDDWFTHTVNDAIDTQRTAPLPRWFFDQWTKELEARKQRQSYDGVPGQSMYDQLKNAYDPKEYADPAVRERIEARLKLVGEFTTGKINKKHFDEGCDFYDAQMPRGKSLATRA